MIIDAHTHVFPPEICGFRERFLTGEEDFALIYENPAARLVEGGELVAALDSWGADAACAFGFPFADTGKSRLCNDYALRAAKEFPGRIIPFACVNPAVGTESVREVERCLAAGARGVGELATYKAGLGTTVREALRPIAELCAEAGAPLLLHANEPVGHEYPGKSRIEVSELYALVKATPRTDWILAHWGGGLFFYELLKKEVSETLARVRYDTSAGPFLYKPTVYRRFIEIAGVEKLLFGTDFPLLELPRYEKDFAEAGLTEDERAAILGTNLAKLLGIHG